MFWVSMVFVAAACIGLICLIGQRVAMALVLSTPPRIDGNPTPISILKPLAGIDDELEQNLECFVDLRYPAYEVLLGVKDAADPAYPVALDFARRYPHRFRVFIQEGFPGHNPKVNQLATLEKHARYDILQVSDSNARVRYPFLQEVATLFDDPEVACTCNPVSGTGHVSSAALADNLHLASTVGVGQIGAKHFAGKAVVVGKSMALRRSVLEKLGGFRHYANALTEDYVIGLDIERKLKLKVAICKCPVWNVAVRKSKRAFVRRYMRWAVCHRTVLALPVSIGQATLNPWPLACVALALHPSWDLLAFNLITFAIKVAHDLSAAWSLECRPLGLKAVALLPLKDLIIFFCWARALFVRQVEWRGNQLRVTAGSQLVSLDGKPFAPPG